MGSRPSPTFQCLYTARKVSKLCVCASFATCTYILCVYMCMHNTRTRGCCINSQWFRHAPWLFASMHATKSSVDRARICPRRIHNTTLQIHILLCFLREKKKKNYRFYMTHVFCKLLPIVYVRASLYNYDVHQVIKCIC